MKNLFQPEHNGVRASPPNSPNRPVTHYRSRYINALLKKTVEPSPSLDTHSSSLSFNSVDQYMDIEHILGVCALAVSTAFFLLAFFPSNRLHSLAVVLVAMSLLASIVYIRFRPN